jgi:hypothetical protein
MIIFLCAILVRPINKVCNIEEVTVTVTDKTVKNTGGDGKYLVFAEDESSNIVTFEITDSLLKMRFNSSDVYAGIKVGCTYKFTVGGSRVKLFSWYPNIYRYELLEEGEE